MNTFRYCLAIVFLLLVKSNSSQDLKTIPLNNKLSILNDRAFFSFPDSAKNSPRAADIMSADYNINQETRITCDNGNKRLVFFAKELYNLGSTDLFEKISNEKTEGITLEHRILQDKDSLLTVLSTPATFDTTREAILISFLQVRTPDNTVFAVYAYINPEAFNEREHYMSLVERVFKTASKGNRRNPRKARTEKLPVFGSKKSFEFQLPENYAVTIDQKYDFQVFKFHKYTTYGDPDWTSLVIYVGHHPSFFYPSYGFEGYNEIQKSDFLGDEVEWYYFGKENFFLKEQKIPGDKVEKGLTLHVAMLGNKKETMDELTEIVKKIKIKK